MKIKTDNKNRVVIAHGSYKDKKIDSVIICKEKDFDEEFGKKLAKAKYKIKEKRIKIRNHEKEISKLNKEKARIDNIINSHMESMNIVKSNLNKKEEEYKELIDNYFSK